MLGPSRIHSLTHPVPLPNPSLHSFVKRTPASLAPLAGHFMVVLLCKDVHLATLSITNPFSHQPVAFTNKELAGFLYWTSSIYCLQLVWQYVSKSTFETATLTTNYEVNLVDRSSDREESTSKRKERHRTSLLIGAARRLGMGVGL